MREVDRRCGIEDWDGVIAVRDACLVATEETGRQLWGPARFAAYRVALDAPAPLAAAMLEPGVMRFGLGPLTEVLAQRHTFDELAPHLDATLRPVVAQERVLRGEDLRADARAAGMPDDPPLVLQPFEPTYALPTYRASDRLDGSFVLPDAGWSPLGSLEPTHAGATGSPGTDVARMRAVERALHDVVDAWTIQSGGEVTLTGSDAPLTDVVRAVAPAATRWRAVSTAELLGLVAFAAASGGVHGRRRGAAAGRSAAWWLARTATGLESLAGAADEADELEYALEDLTRMAFDSATSASAAWRLELALGGPGWAVAVAAFDRGTDEEPAEEPAAGAVAADGGTEEGGDHGRPQAGHPVG